MLERKFCLFWNDGYFKSIDNYNTEHAQGECNEELREMPKTIHTIL